MNSWFLIAALPEILGLLLVGAVHFYEVLNLAPAEWNAEEDK